MSYHSLAMHLLSKLMPPRSTSDVSPQLLLRHEQRFKRIYVWHTVAGMTIMALIPVLCFYYTAFFEKICYKQPPPDALFVFQPETGVLGLTLGLMLTFAFSVPLANWVVRYFIGQSLMEIYTVWYDRHPNHTVDSARLARIMMVFFVSMALLVALYYRYDYTFVSAEKLIAGEIKTLSEKQVLLRDITSVEQQMGKIAPNGDLNRGLCYRFYVGTEAVWETPFFSGSEDLEHLRYKPLVDHILQENKLELRETFVKK